MAIAGGPSRGIEGRTLGDFVVVERMGEGGYGVVYRAEQPLLGRDAVIKVLHERHRDRPETIQRFLREAKLASRLDHPYAAHVYASGAEPDGLLWIAMERVRGTPLDEWLRAHGTFPLEQLVPFVERLCEVVHTAHEQGIVHRDIKPANIMVLARAGRLLPKLLDFGIAKAVGDAAPLLDGADEPADVGVTQDGKRLGSPVYMAPELWVEAAGADARADEYALAITIYEALTGAPPYKATSLRALALAHAGGAPPPVGQGFPPELDAVFARALARAPGDRHADVLELGAAFRAASGVVEPAAALPRLDETLRDELLGEAPTPIAEAVSILDGARGAHQALDAAWQVVTAVVRWAAMTLLAARTRVADGPAPPAIADALRALRRRTLADDEWLQLVRALARPHAGEPDVHPVPELVIAIAGDGAAEALDAVAALRPRIQHAASAADPAARALLAEALPPLEQLLRRLARAFAYRVAVVRGGVAESWHGLHRPLRPAIAMTAALADGAVALVDPARRPAVRLSPLVVAAAPAPGARPELFFLDGHDRTGARFVAFPAGFERHDDAVWDALRGQLGELDDRRDSTSDEDRAPYRGLAAFSPADAASFFGRERETEAFLNRLRVQPFAAVVGPSGAGKSSFVQAGVIPALPAGWRAVTVRPGPAPLAALAARLRAAEIDTGGALDRLREAIATEAPHATATARRDATAACADALRADAEARGPLLLVVDQLEELFTLCADPAERAAYGDVIVAAARAAEDPVRVVVTLRDDFLVRAEQLAALRNRLAAALQLLAVPAPDDLVRIIVEPARRAGYELEDPALAREMVDAVADRPGALALLAFTTARLWELRDRHFRQLTRKAYRALGGVGGALAQHAEKTLDAMTAEERRLTRDAFRNLVTSENTRAVLATDELCQILGGGPAADGVIEKLVAARLVVATEDATGGATIEVVHEALLAAWPRLADWRREDADGARLREQLRASARQWIERGRPAGLLWRGDALAELGRWRDRQVGPLTDAEAAFAEASARDAARGRRIRRGLIATTIAALVGVVIVLAALNTSKETARSRAERSEQVARAQVIELAEEQGRQLYLAGDPVRAATYLADAVKAGGDDPALRYLVARTAGILAHRRHVFVGHRGAVYAGAYTPDGTALVTAGADGIALVWDVGTGAARATLAGHTGSIVAIAIDPTSARAITGGEDQTARIWDLGSGRCIATLLGHTDWVQIVGFSPDGTRALTAGDDGHVRVWDARTGAAIAVIAAGAAIRGAAFADRGGVVVTAAGDRVTRWDATSGARRDEIAVPAVARMAVGDDGALVAAIAGDGSVALSRAGAPLHRLAVQLEPRGVALAPDARSILIWSEADAQVWDVAAETRTAVLRVGGTRISAIGFGPRADRVVIATAEGTVRVFDTATGLLRAALPGVEGPRWFQIAASGAAVAFGGDGGVEEWDAGDDAIVRVLEVGDTAESVAFSADGRRVAACGRDGIVHVWSVTDGIERARIAQSASPCVAALGPDGAFVATGDATGLIQTWDVETGARRAIINAAGPAVNAIAIDALGERLATVPASAPAAPAVAIVWDARSGARVHELAGARGSVYSVAWSRDGARVATCGRDGAALIWRVTDGARLDALAHDLPCPGIAFDPAGQRVITASGKDAFIWRLDTRTRVPLAGHEQLVTTAGFATPELVVTTSYDGSARVWTAASGRQVDRFLHPGPVEEADITRDGSMMATRSDDRIYVWSLAATR